jgi:hypothetical protein
MVGIAAPSHRIRMCARKVDDHRHGVESADVPRPTQEAASLPLARQLALAELQPRY